MQSCVPQNEAAVRKYKDIRSTLTLYTNRRCDLTNCIIFLIRTSHVGIYVPGYVLSTYFLLTLIKNRDMVVVIVLLEK